MRKATERRRASSAGRPASRARTSPAPAGFALRAALGCLDQLLGERLEQAEREFNPAGALDALRGLHVSAADVRRALRSADNLATAGQVTHRIASLLAADPAFGRLVELHALDQFQVMTLLVALAPEVELRYQKVFGYLQDDVTKKRPTVDLVLSLLCADDSERYTRRSEFAADGRLLSRQIVELVPDPNYVAPPLLAQYVKPDEQIVRFLLGDTGLDSRLAGACRMVSSHPVIDAGCVSAEIRGEVRRAARKGVSLWLYGDEGVGHEVITADLACVLGCGQLEVDALRVASIDIEKILSVARREAWLRESLLHVRQADSWAAEARRLVSQLRESTGALIFSGIHPPPTALLGLVHAVEIPLPAAAQRHGCWQRSLADNKVPCTNDTVSALARRFRFTPSQIAAAAADAANRPDADPFAAARAQGGEALRGLADRVVSRANWDDLILADDAIRQLHELCSRADCRGRVLDEWRFGARLGRGRGITALFSGGSGTGKTLAAGVVANALGFELYRIDLARVVSKYIGETEKNLERIFAAAEGANCILLFDEADALFGRRTEVKDARDRYANLETAYLLQRMEAYDGIAILATNLAENLDAAFARRLAFHVFFPFPDESVRLRLWERAWPAQVPLASSVNIAVLARELNLSGGGIRNVALGAAYLAAGDHSDVEFDHVLRAVQREQHKQGQSSQRLPLNAGGLA